MVSVDENLCRKLILTLFLSKLNVPLQVWAVGLNTGLLPSRKSKLGASSMNLSAVRHLSSGGGLHLGKLGLVLELCHQNAHFKSILLGFFNVISCVSKHTVLASEMGRAYRKPPKWLRAGLKSEDSSHVFFWAHTSLPPCVASPVTHFTWCTLSPCCHLLVCLLLSLQSQQPSFLLINIFFSVFQSLLSLDHLNAHFCHSICVSWKCWKTKAFIFFFCVFCEFLADA